MLLIIGSPDAEILELVSLDSDIQVRLLVNVNQWI